MSVTADIWRSWRRGPDGPVRDLLAGGPQETRAFGLLMGGCALVFVAQWPRLARTAVETGEEMPRLVAYELIAWLMVWPLVFYALAALAHGLSRLRGGQGTAWGARAALFWSWLAAAPLGLLYGAAYGLAGPSWPARVLGAAWMLAFAVLWWRSQAEAAHAR